jgi:membrane glycosyltransferase
LFVTPEESEPPRAIRDLEAELGARCAAGRAVWSGFLGAVVDPLRNAVHLELARGPRPLAPKIREARSQLLDRALAGGPEALSDPEKRVVLSDASALAELHVRVWNLEDREAAARWRLAGG